MTQVMAPLAVVPRGQHLEPQHPGPARAAGRRRADRAARRGARRRAARRGPPVFLKVAPDLEPADIDAIARIALDKRLGALIVVNTTISRPPLRSRHAGETGGLSGAPLRELALQRLRDFRKATGGALPLVGVGGIASAEDAWQRIRAGASLVQLYSAMVYEGPGHRAADRARARSADAARRLRLDCRGGRKRIAAAAMLRRFLARSPPRSLLRRLRHRSRPARPQRRIAEAKGVVSAADPRAAEAGAAMLRQGGSATDAAIATMLALTVVEPQSSGIGGGGFLLRGTADGAIETIDGRETAPARRRPALVPRRRRQAAAVHAGGDLGPQRRRAGQCPRSPPRRTGATASCRGRRCSSPRSGSPATAAVLTARAARFLVQAKNRAAHQSRGAGDLLRRGGRAAPGRHRAAQPGAGRDARGASPAKGPSGSTAAPTPQAIAAEVAAETPRAGRDDRRPTSPPTRPRSGPSCAAPIAAIGSAGWARRRRARPRSMRSSSSSSGSTSARWARIRRRSGTCSPNRSGSPIADRER